MVDDDNDKKDPNDLVPSHLYGIHDIDWVTLSVASDQIECSIANENLERRKEAKNRMLKMTSIKVKGRAHALSSTWKY